MKNISKKTIIMVAIIAALIVTNIMTISKIREYYGAGYVTGQVAAIQSIYTEGYDVENSNTVKELNDLFDSDTDAQRAYINEKFDEFVEFQKG